MSKNQKKRDVEKEKLLEKLRGELKIAPREDGFRTNPFHNTSTHHGLSEAPVYSLEEVEHKWNWNKKMEKKGYVPYNKLRTGSVYSVAIKTIAEEVGHQDGHHRYQFLCAMLQNISEGLEKPSPVNLSKALEQHISDSFATKNSYGSILDHVTSPFRHPEPSDKYVAERFSWENVTSIIPITQPFSITEEKAMYSMQAALYAPIRCKLHMICAIISYKTDDSARTVCGTVKIRGEGYALYFKEIK